MHIKLNYHADTKGYVLECDLNVTADNDAEALGYGTMVLFKAAEFLSKFAIQRTDLESRVKIGIAKAIKESEDNPNWPFDITIINTKE